MFKLYNILATQFLGKLSRGQIADGLPGLATFDAKLMALLPRTHVIAACCKSSP